MAPASTPVDRGSPPPEAPARAGFSLALLLVLGAVAFLDRQIVALLVQPIKAALSITDTQISLLQGLAFALLYSGCALPIGYLIDRHSRRLVIFWGVLIWGLAASACGLVTTFGGLLTARVFVGMGEATLAPAAYSILSDLYAKRRLALIISIYSIGSSLGGAAALVIGSQLLRVVGTGMVLPLVGALSPWRAVLLLTGIPGVVLCSLVFLMPEPRRQGPAEGAAGDASWSALATLLRERRGFFAAHLGGFSLMMAIAYASLSWLPSVVQRSFGFTISQVGIALGLFSAGVGVAGLLLNGALVDRLFESGRRDAHLRYYVFGGPIIALSGLAAAFASSPLWFFVLFIPAHLLTNFGGVSAAAVQIVTPPALRGKMSALYLMVVSLFGLIVGPSSVALLSDHVVGPAHVRLAWGIVQAGLGIAAALVFLAGLGPMRRAVAAAGTGTPQWPQ